MLPRVRIVSFVGLSLRFIRDLSIWKILDHIIDKNIYILQQTGLMSVMRLTIAFSNAERMLIYF